MSSRYCPTIPSIRSDGDLFSTSTFETSGKHGIKIAGYSPLVAIDRFKGGPIVPLVEELATKYDVSPAQILLRWQIQKGHIIITNSSNAERQKQQLDVTSFQLTSEDVKKIDNIGATYPIRSFGWGAFKKVYEGVF